MPRSDAAIGARMGEAMGAGHSFLFGRRTYDDLLTRSLMEAQLIDEYLPLIHPLILGSRRRLFGEGLQETLELSNATTTPSGVVIASYHAAR